MPFWFDISEKCIDNNNIIEKLMMQIIFVAIKYKISYNII